MDKINKYEIKTWFVTGASSGIGHELCEQLIKRGYNVVALSKSIAKFASGGGSFLALSVDVNDKESIKNAMMTGIEKFGSIDVLTNFAGISSYITFEETTDEEVRNVIETNYWGTYNTCKAFFKYFREKNSGTIINCSSVMGLVPRSYGIAYCSSKHAIEGLTSVLWMESQNFNLRVMCIEPGLYKTNLGKNNKKFHTNYKEYIFPNTQIINLERNYKNDLTDAVNCIIDTAENKVLPRRLLLGKDCIQRVKFEIETILKDLKYSSVISNKIAKNLNDKQYTFIDDIIFNSKKIKYFLDFIRCVILEKINYRDKQNHYKIKKNKLKNKFKKTWINY